MYRLCDWQCTVCGSVREAYVDTPCGEPIRRQTDIECVRCYTVTLHDRLLSLPAKPLFDRPRNPMVCGGRFDTLGHAPLSPMPDLPSGADETTANYKQLFASREWIEAKAKRKEESRRNKRKRERAAAIARGGNVNMRSDKCPGDPDMR